jgi:hypothetical protein
LGVRPVPADYIRDLRPAKWGSGSGLHGSNPDLPMSALECADQAIPRACTVKAPHIASLTTKAFFGKCQMSFRAEQTGANFRCQFFTP